MDIVFEKAGHFGRYQLVVSIVPLATSIFSAWYILAPVFILFDPAHRCRLPSESEWHRNDTFATQDPQHAAEVARFIPTSANGSAVADSCRNSLNGSDVDCAQWVHDTADFQETLVTELGLFCSQKSVATLLSTCTFAGILFGVVAGGYLADWIGRRRSLLVTLWVLTLSLVASLFAVSPAYSAIVRFFVGAGGLSTSTIAYVMLFEVVGKKYRHHMAAALGYGWAIGATLAPVLALVAGSWRWYAAGCLLPTIAMLAAAHAPHLSPETPRWLASRGRTPAAVAVMQRMLRMNRAPNQQQALEELALAARLCGEGAAADADADAKGGALTMRQSLLLLARSPALLLRYGVICVNWFIVATVYYGIAMGAKNLPGNIFVTSALLGATDFPSNFLLHCTAGRFGRKVTFIAFMSVSGLSLLTMAILSQFAPDLRWLIIAFSLIGRMLNSAAFALIYIWTNELYATPMRSAGLSTSSMCARLGTLFAPLLGNIRDFIPGKLGTVVAYLLFAGVTGLAAVLACAVPETRNSPTADNLLELLAKCDAKPSSQEEGGEKSKQAAVPLMSQMEAAA